MSRPTRTGRTHADEAGQPPYFGTGAARGNAPIRVSTDAASVWVIGPIDLISEFLPVIVPLDDVEVVALAFGFAARRLSREAIKEAWPGERQLLDRLSAQQRPRDGLATPTQRPRRLTGDQG